MPTPLTAYPNVADSLRTGWPPERSCSLANARSRTSAMPSTRIDAGMPMVKVEKDYVFEGPGGEIRLLDMFEGRPQLYIHHFMWIDAIDSGCPSCTAAADLTFTQRDRALLHAKGVTFACVSRAPYANIARYRDEHGWTFPWYSSRDNDFSYDYHVTLDPQRAPIEYNYRSLDELLPAGFSDDALRGDFPGASVFLRRGDEACHMYSAYARGLDLFGAGLSVPGPDTVRTAGNPGRTRPQAGRRVSTALAYRCPRTGSDHRDPNAGPVPAAMAGSCPDAGVAEWLGTGLQSRLHGFESRQLARMKAQLDAISRCTKSSTVPAVVSIWSWPTTRAVPREPVAGLQRMRGAHASNLSELGALVGDASGMACCELPEQLTPGATIARRRLGAKGLRNWVTWTVRDIEPPRLLELTGDAALDATFGNHTLTEQSRFS